MFLFVCVCVCVCAQNFEVSSAVQKVFAHVYGCVCVVCVCVCLYCLLSRAFVVET